MPYSPQERIIILSIIFFQILSYQLSEDFDYTSICIMHQQNTIKDLVESFRKKGSVLNHNHGASAVPVSVLTGEKVEAARSSVVEDPNKSYRKRAKALLMKTIIDVNNTEKRPQVDSL